MAAVAAAGPVGLAVGLAGSPAEEPVATPGGDVAQLLDIDMDQGAGSGVFVAADRLAGGPVQVSEAADAATNQDGMHGGGGQPNPRGDLGRPQPLGPAQVHHLAHQRRGVRRGEWWGRLDRSAIPADPWSR